MMKESDGLIRTGVLGVGHMGSYHANVLSLLPEADFRGVYDADLSHAASVAERYGVDAFSDVESLLDAVDAVCIAVPTEFHSAVACAALERKVHVLLEKPIAIDVEDAARMIELAETRGVVLQIGHIERFNGAIRQLSSIIDTPYLIETRRLAPFNPRISDVGVVLDLMIHDLDIVTSLVDESVVAVGAVGSSCKTRFEDVANAHIRFAGGCVANLVASRTTPEKIRTLSVSQESGYVLLDYDSQEISIHNQTAQEYLLRGREIKYKVASTIERVFVHTVNPLRQEIVHFLRCVSGVEDPLVSNVHDLQTLEIALRVTECIRKDW